MQYNNEIRALDLLSTKGLRNKTPKEFEKIPCLGKLLHEILYTQSVSLILQREFFNETELKLIMQ